MIDLRGKTLLLYDGVCGLCNRLNRFVWSRDVGGEFLFAPLQGELAKRLLAAHGRNADLLDTVFLVTDVGTERERLYERSAAVFEVLRRLPGPWPVVAWARVLPLLLTDAGYRAVAGHRYRLFGRYDACPLPEPAVRARFIDLP